MPVLFPLTGTGVDVVAGTFFWLSGWHEYTVRTRDRHGRFPYEASLQHRWDLAEEPVVDIYRRWLKYRLRSIDVSVEMRSWNGASWAVCPTHDIDYLRKWRPGIVYRELVEYLLLNRGDHSSAERWERLGKLAGSVRQGRDPFRFSWEEMHRREKEHEIRATYFVKTGAHGPYDVSGYCSSGYLQQRITQLIADGFEVGLHPSYHAATHGKYMKQEQEALREMTGQSVRTVRQHYLRYQPPLTTRLHSSLGFQIDSSMAFAERIGFRRGTCLPYRYFDIIDNEATEVWSFPLAVMDSTFFGYGSKTPAAACEDTRGLLDTCREFGGVCVLLWHNIIYDPIDGHGFDRHFEAILEEVCSSTARVGSIGETFDGWIHT
jgi:hypothetical protein